MRVKFLGAAGTVTGSSYALTSGSGRTILIDLGMFQGLPEIDRLNYEPLAVDPRRLDGVILTHAHLDHCGRLPIIFPKGYRGNVWMTSPTRDLTELSLLDSANIAKNSHKKALYDRDLVIKTLGHFKTVDYHVAVPISDFIVTMKDAGHILGSASLEIIDTKPDSGTRKIVFSGDLGNSPEPLVRETENIGDADAVVMESTYGDRLHPKESPAEVVQAEINAVEKTGGTLLIPVFSLERTQVLLHMIMHLKGSGKVKAQTPVFMDSPMAEKATAIYLNYPELFNPHIQGETRIGGAFGFPGLTRGVSKREGTKVILAGSGMMSGGRIVEHAANYLPIPSTRLLIVGYQAEGTLGREILDGKRNVVINGKNISIKATVSDTQAMSSHADYAQLMAWLGHIEDVKKVCLIHGEDGPRAALAQKITNELGIRDVSLPKLNQEIKL